jgi:hypothetical protein
MSARRAHNPNVIGSNPILDLNLLRDDFRRRWIAHERQLLADHQDASDTIRTRGLHLKKSHITFSNLDRATILTFAKTRLSACLLPLT